MSRTVFTSRNWAFVALLVVGSLAGCGGDHLATDQGLAVFGGTVELVRDETRTARVATHLVIGEKPSVATFSTTSMPEGVTGVFDPTTVDFSTINSRDVDFTLTASRTAPTGTYTGVVRRTRGDNNEFFTDSFKVRIIDFAVDVDADDSSVSLGPGDSHDTTITLHRRGNSNGTVEFDLGGDLPDGVSWEFDPPRAVIDVNHPTVHTKLTLSADSSADTTASKKCHVRVLKGTNVDNSDDIDVTLTVPDAESGAIVKKKH